MLEEFDWYRLANGGADCAMRVGELSQELCHLMQCDDRRVMFDPAYSPKIRFKHDLDHSHLGMIPVCLDCGTVVQNPQTRNTLSFFYEDGQVFGRIFHLVVKTTGRRHELWVTTFFAVSNAEFNRRCRRGNILRRQT